MISHLKLKMKHFYKEMEKNILFISIGVAGIIIVGALLLSRGGIHFQNIHVGGLLGGFQSNKAIAQKAVDYINNNKLSQDTASLDGNTSMESGLVKFKIKIGSNSYDSYATKDGKLFFPQAFQLTK